MKKKTKAVEKEYVDVDITEGKELRSVSHFTDRHYATGTRIDFSTYMFRIKVEGDDDNGSTCDDGPDSYSCVIYLNPKVASELSLKLKSAVQQYERKYGSILGKEQ
jgi:hypothetical protein